MGVLNQVQSGRRIDTEGQETERDTVEDAQKPEEVRKDFGSHFRSLDLTLRAMNGAPSKGFKRESHLIRKVETFLSLKISGQWEQTLAPDLEPQRLPASREKGAHGSKDLGS